MTSSVHAFLRLFFTDLKLPARPRAACRCPAGTFLVCREKVERRRGISSCKDEMRNLCTSLCFPGPDHMIGVWDACRHYSSATRQCGRQAGCQQPTALLQTTEHLSKFSRTQHTSVARSRETQSVGTAVTPHTHWARNHCCSVPHRRLKHCSGCQQ